MCFGQANNDTKLSLENPFCYTYKLINEYEILSKVWDNYGYETLLWIISRGFIDLSKFKGIVKMGIFKN